MKHSHRRAPSRRSATPAVILLAGAAVLSTCSGAQSGSTVPCAASGTMRVGGQCYPCGGAGQACCPDEDPSTGPPFGAYCLAAGTDCLAPESGGENQCLPCGHLNQRACASGCVQGFPAPGPQPGMQTCSCGVPRGMSPLPGCPATTP